MKFQALHNLGSYCFSSVFCLIHLSHHSFSKYSLARHSVRSNDDFDDKVMALDDGGHSVNDKHLDITSVDSLPDTVSLHPHHPLYFRDEKTFLVTQELRRTKMAA